jgi:hypothetical protein
VSLQEMDATREQSRWKVAERILQERSLPWSRLTAELEQCMVPDMRLKGIQRVRSNAQQVVLKVKGEARTREAEAGFVEALRAAPVFAQVVLERESERAGGGWEFEISLPAAAVPPPFRVKPVKTASAAPGQVPARTQPHPVPLTLPRPTAPKPPPAAGAPGRRSPPAVVPQARGAAEGVKARPLAPEEEEESSYRRRRSSRSRPIDPRTPR